MSTPETEKSLVTIVLTCQIIIASLLMGPILFLAIAAFVGPLMAQKAGAPAAAPALLPADPFAMIMTYSAVAAGALALCMSFILPPRVSANARKAALKPGLVPKTPAVTGKAAKLQPIDEAQATLLPLFPSQLIVGAAILEGATFFAAVVYFLVGGLIPPAVAIVLMIVMIARFPTKARVQLWLDQERDKFRDEEFAATASA